MSFFAEKFSQEVQSLAAQAQLDCAPAFEKIEKIKEYNQQKVLAAFIHNNVSETHFHTSSGYGYGDRGRDVLDAVYAEVFGAEDALVRHNFVSGTHALAVALFGVLRPGDTMLCITGSPYDTLEEVIGIRGSGEGSLKEFGVNYRQIELLSDGTVDLDAVKQQVGNVQMVYIQRSRGYSLRPSLSVDTIGRICAEVRACNPEVMIVVDNCYGEFVEKKEPVQVGADLMIGSLIKNAGGGLATTGGYIAGKKELVEKCAYRLTAPGVGRELGCTLGQNKNMFMGLFFAPNVVGEALKSAVFASRLFELAGFRVTPEYRDSRADIIQSICLNTAENLTAFCKGIQSGSPIDSFVVPEPCDTPGYESQVIMAAGAFNTGASIELSADAPLREPYAVWMQGGLTYYSSKIGIM
ncbi:MAG: hypothetical protein EGP89_01310, partial [Ruminococcaceae bacterium]|nr:hypothetical protein [Oscillospiraceae bacterium]